MNDEYQSFLHEIATATKSLVQDLNKLYIQNSSATIRNVHYTILLALLKKQNSSNQFNFNLLTQREKSMINDMTDNSTAMLCFCTLLLGSRELTQIVKQSFRSVREIMDLIEFCGTIAEEDCKNPNCIFRTNIMEATKVIGLVEQINIIHYSS